jgi:hypothetical protein
MALLSEKNNQFTVLHSKHDPKSVGNFLSLETEADRTLFFDLLPINLEISKVWI